MRYVQSHKASHSQNNTQPPKPSSCLQSKRRELSSPDICLIIMGKRKANKRSTIPIRAELRYKMPFPRNKAGSVSRRDGIKRAEYGFMMCQIKKVARQKRGSLWHFFVPFSPFSLFITLFFFVTHSKAPLDFPPFPVLSLLFRQRHLIAACLRKDLPMFNKILPCLRINRRDITCTFLFFKGVGEFRFSYFLPRSILYPLTPTPLHSSTCIFFSRHPLGEK